MRYHCRVIINGDPSFVIFGNYRSNDKIFVGVYVQYKSKKLPLY